MVNQLENYRESISGVSMDEEMVNLVKYQNAYQAAAKLITTADEMMQSVLNMI
jgi:flagellar hook-associated protein 1 FlgK